MPEISAKNWSFFQHFIPQRAMFLKPIRKIHKRKHAGIDLLRRVCVSPNSRKKRNRTKPKQIFKKIPPVILWIA